MSDNSLRKPSQGGDMEDYVYISKSNLIDLLLKSFDFESMFTELGDDEIIDVSYNEVKKELLAINSKVREGDGYIILLKKEVIVLVRRYIHMKLMSKYFNV